MKLTVDRDVLAGAVTWAARAIAAKPVSPLLAGIRLEAGPALTLSAFDYEVSAEATIPVTAQCEPGTALVPGRLLAEIVRSLPAKSAELATEGPRLRLSCGPSTFSLMLLPEGDYPTLPSMPPAVGTAGSDLFAAAAGQVAIAASRDDALPVLTGVHVQIDGNQLTLAATDRYRLAVRTMPWDPAQPGTTGSMLVPTRILADVARAATSAAQITLSLAAPQLEASAGLAGFEASGRRTTARLIDGDYPRYQALIPGEFSAVAEVRTGELAEAVKRVALVAERNTAVRLTFTAGRIGLEAGTGDEAQASEELDAAYTGHDGLVMAFNPHYLLDGLHALGTDTTRLAFSPGTPGLFTGKASAPGTGDDEDPPDYRYLLMPIRIA